MPAPKDVAKRNLWLLNLSKAHKGKPAWNKNRIMPLEFRLKMAKISKQFWSDIGNKEKIEIRNRKVALSKTGDRNPMKKLEVRQKVGITRIKMGLAAGDKNPSHTSAVRAKISKALLGHSVPYVVRKKISKKLEGKLIGELNPFWGRHHTPAVKEKSKNRAIQMIASGLLTNRRTGIELKIRAELERNSLFFIEQFPLENITVADFYLPTYRIIVYCDGDYWHKGKWAEKYHVISKDQRQTQILERGGYRVFRFSEAEINASAKQCVETILLHAEKISI